MYVSKYSAINIDCVFIMEITVEEDNVWKAFPPASLA
jgi:hypothetical protein